MRVWLRKVGWDGPSASGRVLPAALLVLLATAACGGDRGKPVSAGDSTGTASPAAATDTGNKDTTNRMNETAATATSDSTAASRKTSSTAPAKSDSGAATARQPSDTARKRSQSAGPRPAKRAASATAPSATAPSATASQDTGAKAQDTSAKAKADTGAAAAAAADQSGELRDAYHQASKDTVNETVYDGWKQFNLNCARCHGEDALGTTIAPHLIVSLRPDGPINTKELFMSTVCAGRPAKGMPAWCSLGLGMDKIQDIYAYVKGRSDGKIHPGRPAVREGT
jgi:mono/diheme cytochrome c family protein